MQETRVRFLGKGDPLKEEMVTNSSVLSWKIPWTGDWWTTVHGVEESGTTKHSTAAMGIDKKNWWRVVEKGKKC